MRFLTRRIENLLSAWTISSSSGLHLNMLDGLRGLAILMVVAGHAFYYNLSGPKAPIVNRQDPGSGIHRGADFFRAVGLSDFLSIFPVASA